MKKTLIALAVLASSGASFAQVTITGNLAMGYRATTTAAAPTGDLSGFGVDTSQINFSAKEDLGGGMKISADMALAGADRSGESLGGGVVGRDAVLALTTGANRISLKSYEVPNYLTGGLLSGMGPGQDGKVFAAKGNVDAVAFDTAMGPFSLGFEHRETAANGIGAGASGSASVVGQRSNVLSGTYTVGPLAANLQYASLDNRDTVAPLLTTDSVIQTSATYDFGMAKVGAALVATSMTSGRKDTDTVLAVSVPLGATTLSANWASNKIDATVGGGTKSGYGLKGEYALSKRTSMIAQYARWDSSNVATSTNTRTDLLLSHSF